MKMLKLIPFVADNIWGGTRLRDEYDIQSNKNILAEAWVLSCHPKGPSIIQGGEFDSRTLADVLQNEGKDYLGTHAEKFDDFPILIKLIDAKDDLSVQVHPTDEYALKHENQYGKTECWYILDAEDDAEIIYGLNSCMSRQELAQIIENDEILQHVHRIKAKPGDFFFIPGGTVHAICKGICLAEVQQNSDVTYRIFDYNRLQDGKPRELHKSKATDVINCEKILPAIGKPQGQTKVENNNKITKLTKNELFETKIVEVESEFSVFVGEESFLSIVALDGNGVIMQNDTVMTLYKGESVFVPANMGEIKIMGALKLLLTNI